MNVKNFSINKNTKHLYIHIPYCKHICTYCDFFRFIPKNENQQIEYIQLIIFELKKYSQIFSTIYIGGGTPNFLSNELLNKLLNCLQNNIDKNTEFTIECNPDLINQDQINIFKKNNVNRISLGIQSLNNKILKLVNRQYDDNKIEKVIKLLYKNKMENISCDFIYNLPLMKEEDLEKIFDFVIKHKIKHISFYALEMKDNSILNKQNFQINLDNEDLFFEKIKAFFKSKKYINYEISNWAINNKYKSKHNLSYWNMNNWIAVGIGAYGFENNNYYKITDYDNLNKKFIYENNQLQKKELYQYVLMMGLRLSKGIDIKIDRNNLSYLYFKNKIEKDVIIKNNKLKAKNINNLNELLIKII